MCYSAGMSFSLAAVGALCTIASAVDPVLRRQLVYVPFAFYTCMELLQGVQYSHVNLCGSLANATSTEIAYVLVIVQPLMWNLLYYLRTPATDCDRRLFVVGMAMAVVWMAFSLAARLLSGQPGFQRRTNDVHSYVADPDAGASAATANGCTMQATPENHLYWKWASADFHGVDANWLMYLMIWFVPALLCATQRRNVSIAIAAAAIAMVVTFKYGAKMAEFSSLWCMYSIPLLTVMLVDLAVSQFKGVGSR